MVNKHIQELHDSSGLPNEKITKVIKNRRTTLVTKEPQTNHEHQNKCNEVKKRKKETNLLSNISEAHILS